MEELPIDIICVIFGLLGVRSQLRFAQTCKLYRQIALEKKDRIWLKFQTKMSYQKSVFSWVYPKLSVEILYLPEIEDIMQIHVGAMRDYDPKNFGEMVHGYNYITRPDNMLITYKNIKIEIEQFSVESHYFDETKIDNHQFVMITLKQEKGVTFEYQARIYEKESESSYTKIKNKTKHELLEITRNTIKLVAEKFYIKIDQAHESIKWALRALR